MITSVSVLSARNAWSAIDQIACDVDYSYFCVEMALAPKDGGDSINISDGQIPSHWIGSAARGFGLTGSTKTSDIINLFQNGFLPDGRVVRPPHVSMAMSILAIAAQKSISILQAHPDEQVRRAADTAMLAGEAAVIEALEACARSQIGTSAKNDPRLAPAQGIVASSWQHRSSSTMTPYSYMDIAILSTAPCADGKWRKIDILGAIKMADAAAIFAIEKSISKSLGLSDNDWTKPTMSDSTQYREIKSLLKFINPLSEERKSVSEIAKKIDATMVLNGDAAVAIRNHWNEACGGELFKAFDNIRVKENPTPEPGVVISFGR